MTSTDLVVQSTAYSRASLTERQQYVGLLVRAGNLLPASLREGLTGNPGKTFLMCETGDMLGIHPIAALTGVHIIDGKPSISANLMGGLVRKAGHRLRITTKGSYAGGDLSATATLARSDDPEFEFVVTWDMERAKRAGLLPPKSGSGWSKYQEAMMKARAISEVIREGAPDVLMGGNVFTPEELGANVNEEGEPVDMPQVQEDTPQGEAPRTEAPIVDEPAEAPADTDWAKAIREVTSREEALTLYHKASAAGLLNSKIKVGRKSRELGEVIKEVGKALAEAEAATGEPLPNEEPAVLADPDTGEVVDAEIVEDGQ